MNKEDKECYSLKIVEEVKKYYNNNNEEVQEIFSTYEEYRSFLYEEAYDNYTNMTIGEFTEYMVEQFYYNICLEQTIEKITDQEEQATKGDFTDTLGKFIEIKHIRAEEIDKGFSFPPNIICYMPLDLAYYKKPKKGQEELSVPYYGIKPKKSHNKGWLYEKTNCDKLINYNVKYSTVLTIRKWKKFRANVLKLVHEDMKPNTEAIESFNKEVGQQAIIVRTNKHDKCKDTQFLSIKVNKEIIEKLEGELEIIKLVFPKEFYNIWEEESNNNNIIGYTEEEPFGYVEEEAEEEVLAKIEKNKKNREERERREREQKIKGFTSAEDILNIYNKAKEKNSKYNK